MDGANEKQDETFIDAGFKGKAVHEKEETDNGETVERGKPRGIHRTKQQIAMR